MNRKSNVLRLTESAIMIALATVLSEIKLVDMPMGGSVTAFSMVPIIIIAYRYGTKWGLFTGFVQGLFQMLLGMHNLKSAGSVWAVIAVILFDYLVAFGVLGLGGVFRKSIKSQGLAMAAGSLLVSVLRYACHFISGWAVWGVWAPEGMPAWLYSLEYNATYMVPEAIVTVVGSMLICGFLDFSSRDITRRGKNLDSTYERSNAAVAAKMAGLSVIIGGLFYDIFDAVNVLMVEDAEVSKESLLAVLAVTVVVGVVLYALGEIVQLLSDLRNSRCGRVTSVSQLEERAKTEQEEQ